MACGGPHDELVALAEHALLYLQSRRLRHTTKPFSHHSMGYIHGSLVGLCASPVEPLPIAIKAKEERYCHPGTV